MHEKHYEERLDYNLAKLLPEGLRIERAGAMNVGKPRLIGDIGLRGFIPMYKKAKAIIRNEKIDFVYITIPSFYGALWGRWLHETTGVPYGIDYIDPWVHEFPGSNRLFSRHWWATKVSGLLEPIAVKKAALITGVAASYYEGVKQRNPHLNGQCRFMAIPYGSEKTDHLKVKELALQPYLFQKTKDKFQFVYAGAMLPKSYYLLEKIFDVIRNNEALLGNIALHFIGTGKSPNDAEGYNIKPLALEKGLWQKQVFEYPARIPYLDVLVHLNTADAVFILGSTEAHYTPSKVYQAVLSQKPVLAVLHEESTAVEVLERSGCGLVLSFNENNMDERLDDFAAFYKSFLLFFNQFDVAKNNLADFDQYSAATVTRLLADKLDEITAH